MLPLVADDHIDINESECDSRKGNTTSHTISVGKTVHSNVNRMDAHTAYSENTHDAIYHSLKVLFI